MTDGFIPPHGGYRKLLSYQRAAVVYEATVRFCERCLDRQISQLERAFVEDGGLRERMTAARLRQRAGQAPRRNTNPGA
jgi:four helix bundle suffix protein